MPVTRRDLLLGAAGAFAFRDDTLKALASLTRESEPDPQDESFWRQVRSQFNFDPKIVPFNNVGLSPSPKAVLEAQAAEVRRANTDPSYIIWRRQDRELDTVTKDLAELVGCKTEELALTMNATYGLQTGILGVSMAAGNEIVSTSHDYSRAHTAIDQRVRRDGVVYVEVPMPSQPEDDATVVKAVLAKVTPKTRLVVLCTMTYLIGQVLPIRPIAQALAARDIPVLLDGAQSIGLLPDKLDDLGAPLYTACLHKWLMGPIGTGVMVVREPWIPRVWPLHPADQELTRSIAKFQQVGTRPAAPFLALRETLEFHHWLSQKAKAERLERLRQRLANHFVGSQGVRLYGSLDPEKCRGMLTVGFDKVKTPDLAGWLFTEHKIHVTTAVRAGIDGIRISPHVFTSIAEVDHLGGVLAKVAKDGI